jgi:hypothetical protein
MALIAVVAFVVWFSVTSAPSQQFGQVVGIGTGQSPNSVAWIVRGNEVIFCTASQTATTPQCHKGLLP